MTGRSFLSAALAPISAAVPALSSFKFWPTSRRSRRRLTLVLAAAPVLALAAFLAVRAMGDAVVFFYTPSQLTAENAAPGRALKLGGLVQSGSVRRDGDVVRFTVGDGAASRTVAYRGQLPDLFREGQGVVAQGRFGPDGEFVADTVLAKHDEQYMPRELQRELQRRGEWRGAPVS